MRAASDRSSSASPACAIATPRRSSTTSAPRSAPTVSVAADPGRTSGRGYYRDVCFKVVARPGREEVEIGDGGFTDWTAQLTGDRKRRLLVAGLGLDRIAALAPG